MTGFTWRDGERTIRFGRGVVAEAVEVLGGEGYALLTTERAAAMAPAVVEGAAAVHMLGAGLVDELAGDLLGAVARERIVGLGGGRVVDTAKSLAAASGGTQVAMAVPTTLSGAEMTRIHRRARGADQRAPTVRARVVVNDPELSASQPLAELAASALNALGHAIEGPCTPLANPVATLAAHDGRAAARALARRRARPRRPRARRAARRLRDRLDRLRAAPRALADARAVGGRRPRAGQRRAARLTRPARSPGASRSGMEAIGRRPRGRPLRGGGAHVRARGRHAAARPRHRAATCSRECAEAAAERPELDLTPPRADRAELLALYEAAW